MAKIWAVCSGSGGVGKSMIALSLAVGAANMGRRTVLLDASGVSRSCDLALGLESVVVLDMVDVVSQQTDIESALYRVPRHLNLRFASASLYDSVPIQELSSALLALHSICDVLVIDLPTGQADLGAGLLGEQDVRIMVTRPDDASIRACERVIMRMQGERVEHVLAINRINRERLRKGTQYDAQTVQSILDCRLIGCIPEDSSIIDGEKRGYAAIECHGAAYPVLSAMVKTLLD